MADFELIKDFEVDGFRCVILKTTIEILCGYVALPLHHPYFDKDIEEIPCEVHGGVTYAEPSLALVDADGALQVWWIGFDCLHIGDAVPSIPALSQGVYRDEKFVEEQLRALVAQLKDVKAGG